MAKLVLPALIAIQLLNLSEPQQVKDLPTLPAPAHFISLDIPSVQLPTPTPTMHKGPTDIVVYSRPMGLKPALGGRSRRRRTNHLTYVDSFYDRHTEHNSDRQRQESNAQPPSALLPPPAHSYSRKPSLVHIASIISIISIGPSCIIIVQNHNHSRPQQPRILPSQQITQAQWRSSTITNQLSISQKRPSPCQIDLLHPHPLPPQRSDSVDMLATSTERGPHVPQPIHLHISNICNHPQPQDRSPFKNTVESSDSTTSMGQKPWTSGQVRNLIKRNSVNTPAHTIDPSTIPGVALRMSTPTIFVLPTQSQASPSRISTAGRPPRSRTPWRNGLDPRQGCTEQAPSNKSNIMMTTLELLVEDLYNKDKVDIESIQLEDCFSVPRVPTAISPQAKPTTAPSVSSARLPSRAPQRGPILRK
ncbi:hypothetical protein CF326_g9270 [Tilletia indica]|nr:hypothetical protein CF326_g9270 [Tilletia indica]